MLSLGVFGFLLPLVFTFITQGPRFRTVGVFSSARIFPAIFVLTTFSSVFIFAFIIFVFFQLLLAPFFGEQIYYFFYLVVPRH